MAGEEIAALQRELSAAGDPMSVVGRTLAASVGATPRIEYELNYDDDSPRAADFGRDLVYVDREVRRTARIARDEMLHKPFRVRRSVYPLRTRAGLRVRKGEMGSFRFLLDVPYDIYVLILSQPVDFAIRLFELTQLYTFSAKHFVRIRQPDGSATVELPVPNTAAEMPYVGDADDLGAASLSTSIGGARIAPEFQPHVPANAVEAAASYEIIQRVTQTDDETTYEFIERVIR